jgi:hypothetical protein
LFIYLVDSACLLLSIRTDHPFQCGSFSNVKLIICLQILELHIIPAAVKAADLSDGQVVTTIGGEKLTVSVKPGTITFTAPNGGMVGTVIKADIMSCKGVVHIIDMVLTPGDAPEPEPEEPEKPAPEPEEPEKPAPEPEEPEKPAPEPEEPEKPAPEPEEPEKPSPEPEEPEKPAPEPEEPEKPAEEPEEPERPTPSPVPTPEPPVEEEMPDKPGKAPPPIIEEEEETEVEMPPEVCNLLQMARIACLLKRTT